MLTQLSPKKKSMNTHMISRRFSSIDSLGERSTEETTEEEPVISLDVKEPIKGSGMLRSRMYTPSPSPQASVGTSSESSDSEEMYSLF